MPTYALRIPPKSIVQVIRTETARAQGQPELYINAYRDYVIDEDYDTRRYAPADQSRYSQVISESVLNIEARLERNYWVLAVVVHQDLGLRVVDDENALLGATLTLDEFDAALRSAPATAVSVRLEASTFQAKAHFEEWWAEMMKQTADPAPATAGNSEEIVPAAARAAQDAANQPADRAWNSLVREVVGVLANADALDTAVDELERCGFTPAGISVLGAEQARERLGRLYRSVADIEDASDAPQAAFVSRDSRVEVEAAAVAWPFMIGGLAGAGAVVASGGILAGAIAATILGGAVGGGLGALVSRAVAHRHAQTIADQLALGGLVLWVRVPNDAAERQAIEALGRVGARDIHAHTVQRAWGPRDRPLAEAQVDPFLDKDLLA